MALKYLGDYTYFDELLVDIFYYWYADYRVCDGVVG